MNVERRRFEVWNPTETSENIGLKSPRSWRYIVLLFAIGRLMATPPLCVNPSREEVWLSNFNAISEFYKDNGHLSIRSPKLSQCLNGLPINDIMQRPYPVRSDQLEKLESIHYNDVAMYRECDVKAWVTKLSQLKDSRDKDGKIKARDIALSSWLTRQRRYFNDGRLDPERRRKLEQLGVDLSLSIAKRNKNRINEENRKRWITRYNRLKEYKRLNGHCDVPRRYNDDPELGDWVFSQRKKYKAMQNGGNVMDEDRISMLEEIGFNWSLRKPPPNQS